MRTSAMLPANCFKCAAVRAIWVARLLLLRRPALAPPPVPRRWLAPKPPAALAHLSS